MFSYWPFLSQYLAIPWFGDPTSRGLPQVSLEAALSSAPEYDPRSTACGKVPQFPAVPDFWKLDDPWLNSLPWHQWFFCILLQCCLKGCLKILLHGVFSALGAVVREIFMGETWVFLNTTTTQTCDNSSLDHPMTANNHLNPHMISSRTPRPSTSFGPSLTMRGFQRVYGVNGKVSKANVMCTTHIDGL